MMTCQLCNNTDGPFEFADVKQKVMLICEDCSKKIKKQEKKKKKEHDAYYNSYEFRR